MTRSVSLFLTVFAVFAVVAGVARAQQRPQEKDEPPGIAVGKKAPDFKLRDQEGKERSLKELLAAKAEEEPDGKPGEHVVALVFYRSADW